MLMTRVIEGLRSKRVCCCHETYLIMHQTDYEPDLNVQETVEELDQPWFYSDPKLEYLLDLADETEYVCCGVVVTRGELVQPSKYTPATAAALLEEYRCELLEENPDLCETISIIPAKIDITIYDEPERFQPRPSRLSKISFCSPDTICEPIPRELVLSVQPPSIFIQESPIQSLHIATPRKLEFLPPRFAKPPLIQGCNQLINHDPTVPSIQINQNALGNFKLQKVIFINVLLYQIGATVPPHLLLIYHF